MSRETVLVTGATGMVGSHVVRRAVESGYKVRAMVRRTSLRDIFDNPNVEQVIADLADPESLESVMEGIDVVVHAAAHVGDWGPAEKYRAINVHALEYLITAAVRVGRLKRWIQISSLGVYPARHHYGTDETTPISLTGLDGYTRTKAEAEVLLRRRIDQSNFPAVILRPGFIYGPGDRHIVPRLIERLGAGKMKLIGDGKRLMNNTYVGNLVGAIFLAIRKDEAVGEIFNIRDERLVDREEFVGAIADYMGEPQPPKVPEWLARAAVGPIEAIARFRGAETAPLLTKGRIKFLTLNLNYSIAKAREVLGYRAAVDFRHGMGKALDWAAAENLIPGMTAEAAKTTCMTA